MRFLVSLLSLILGVQSSPLKSFLLSRQEALNICLDDAGLDYVDANSDNWAEAIQSHNLHVPITPKAIVYATSTKQVQDAVLCGVDSGIKVSAKSGGHSYASMGLGGQDGSLVIQLDHWYSVKVQSDDTALITPGTRLGIVATELYKQGQRGISHGTCPSVGVGGHAVYGGYGFSSHTHGLNLDGIIGANIVLANGTLVHASQDENNDLFWAIRGGGSSFGIVTEFQYQTFDTSQTFSWFSIASNLPSRPRQEVVAGLMEFQKWLESGSMDRKLNMRLEIGANTTLEVVYHGPEDEARTLIEPLVEPLGLEWSANRTQAHEGAWLDNLKSWTYGDPLNITYPYTGHIPETAMTALIDYFFDVASRNDSLPWWFQMDVHADPNSAIAAVPQDATAYAHRDKLWLFQVASPLTMEASDEEAAIAFVHAFLSTLTDNMDDDAWGRYANYIDSELSREEAEAQYWGAHVPRLQAIKEAVDPTNVFSNPQSIQPA